jgi:molecular chaperone HscB
MKIVNYFDLLNLPRCYFLESDELESNYQEILRKFHPDQWGGGIAKDSVGRLAAQINQAYIALKDPLTRAQHLLELSGLWPYTPEGPLMERFFSLQEQRVPPDIWEKEYSLALEKMKSAFEKEDHKDARDFLWWAMMSQKSREALL